MDTPIQPNLPPQEPMVPGPMDSNGPAAPGQEELSQEQMKSNLQDMMSKIDGKYQDFNTQKFSSDSKLKEQQSEVLRQIFNLFKSMGVDPSDPAAVKAMLDKIKTINPALYQQIESAMIGILGNENAGPQEDILSEGEPIQGPEPAPTPEPVAPPEATMPTDQVMNQNATPPQL